MKKLVQYFLMTVALGVPSVVYAQDEETPASAESTSAQEQDGLNAVRKQAEELDKQVAELKDTSRSFNSRYERFKQEVERYNKRIEELQQKVQEREKKVREVTGSGFYFDIVREEERDMYAKEGLEKVEKITKLLNGKEAEQIEGVIQFESLYEGYQGIPGYVAAHAQYKKVLERMEKKWTAARAKVQRDRQKLTGVARTKADDNEQAFYRRVAKKLEGQEKDIEKDWFTPTAPMMTNGLLLDQLLRRVSVAKRFAAAEPEEDAEKIPGLIDAYWEEMDAAVRQLSEGNPARALEMVNDCKSYDEVSSARFRSLPEKYRKAIRDQHTKLREELRRLSGEHRRAVSDVEREKRNLENEVSRFGSAVENMTNVLNDERENLERKAAEEAERKAAEEEAAREAAEEEADGKAAADDAEKADEDKPAKKKKKRKKSADKGKD